MRVNWISVSLILILVFILAVLPNATAKSETEYEDKTRVRPMGRPHTTYITSRSSGLTQLKEIKVEIKNVGSTDAEGVRVEATLPDGSTTSLSGPSSLAKNQKANYYAKPWSYVPDSKNKRKSIRVKADCTNCHR